jgi:pimeloyl-ACP methyl ester carboxylesterase
MRIFMQIKKIQKLLIIGILFLLLDSNILLVKGEYSKNENFSTPSPSNHLQYIIETYDVTTNDGFFVTLTRYVGSKHPSIMLIHGMGCNHKIFDWDENHSLARFLNNNGWDVWMLDLRTHDGDGDYFFIKGSNREYINRYWDFDNTLLKIDVVTAIDFVKRKTGCNKIVLSGQSYGGYLAYAYAELIGEENLSGIITSGASPYANPISIQLKRFEMIQYGFYFGQKAFVSPIGKPWTYRSKFRCDMYSIFWKPTANDIFYYNTTPAYIQKEIIYHGDSEPAGVWVDMFFGKDPNKYGGHWVDPQTLYDYSKNLYKITVPILFIAGDNDTQDPMTGIYSAYENVSSTIKENHSFLRHSHLDLLLGDDASSIIFPIISQWMNSRISR